MKDLITDANFPRTADLRVYHLGIRTGEVANRIITVGSPSRAKGLALLLDAVPVPFVLTSERGFLTITGRYQGTPISIISIGMGSPNVDFFVREVRECLNGDMVVARLGSCGALVNVPVGSIVIPHASIAVTRNYDFDFATGHSHDESPYRFSKPVNADVGLHSALRAAMEENRPEDLRTTIISDVINASADSFYSSQGRQTSFPDHNKDLIQNLLANHADLATFEMETFHILHLAASWRTDVEITHNSEPPLSARPVSPTIVQYSVLSNQTPPSNVRLSNGPSSRRPRIRAAAVQMVFASRTSQDFITPEKVAETEAWCGKALLEAMSKFQIQDNMLHPEGGSVWELKKDVNLV